MLYRIGQRARPHDDGHWLSNAVNATLFGVLVLVTATVSNLPVWNRTGFVALVIGGITGTVLGRFSLLRGIRMVGATRGNTFQAATPVTAALIGWIALGENISPIEATGGALTIVGLVRIVRNRATNQPRGVDTDAPTLRGYIIASGAPIFFGIAFVIRKWGLEQMPGSVVAAFIGSASGILVLSIWESARGNLRTRITDGLSISSWPFLSAGVITTVALLAQFLALERMEAWIVGILLGTSAIWTAALSLIFLREDEKLTISLFVNIVIVFIGIVVIAAG